MDINTTDAFIVIRWPETTGLPRYSFVTPPHLREVQADVQQIGTCSRIDEAVAIVARLNAGAGLAADNQT